MRAVQLSLDLFAAPSFEEIVSRDGIRHLSISIDSRLKSGWRVVEQRGGRRLCVPVFLADAPEEIKRAVIAWALLPLKCRRGSRSHRMRKELAHRVWEYLREHGKLPSRQPRLDVERFENQAHASQHNLREIFDELNQYYFNGRLVALVRWGSVASKTSYHAVRHDRAGNTYHTITIGGIYDDPTVPSFVVRAVMYHEMLHIALPPCKKNGRRLIHGAAFRQAERAYPHYQQWRQWERTSLGTLAARHIKKSRLRKHYMP